MSEFTEEQTKNARLAQMLRELVPYISDVNFDPVDAGDGTLIPCIWPASNIKERLMDAADLIDTLTLRVGASA